MTHKILRFAGIARLTPNPRGLLYRRNYAFGKLFADFLFCVLLRVMRCDVDRSVGALPTGRHKWSQGVRLVTCANSDRTKHSELFGRISMNRTVVSGIAAFALLIGAMAMNPSTAEAGRCGGGLFAKLQARNCGGGGLFSGHQRDRGCGGGGLFSGHQRDRGCGGGLLARLRARRAAKCGAPEPADCCEAAPAPCCEPAPAPCCDPAPAPCCGQAAAPVAPCCGGVVAGGASDGGYDLAPGETLVPGSVETVDGGGDLPAPVSSSDAAPVEEAAPPAPTPDASTDA